MPTANAPVVIEYYAGPLDGRTETHSNPLEMTPVMMPRWGAGLGVVEELHRYVQLHTCDMQPHPGPCVEAPVTNQRGHLVYEWRGRRA